MDHFRWKILPAFSPEQTWHLTKAIAALEGWSVAVRSTAYFKRLFKSRVYELWANNLFLKKKTTKNQNPKPKPGILLLHFKVDLSSYKAKTTEVISYVHFKTNYLRWQGQLCEEASQCGVPGYVKQVGGNTKPGLTLHLTAKVNPCTAFFCISVLVFSLWHRGSIAFSVKLPRLRRLIFPAREDNSPVLIPDSHPAAPTHGSAHLQSSPVLWLPGAETVIREIVNSHGETVQREGSPEPHMPGSCGRQGPQTAQETHGATELPVALLLGL